jgi:microsomal prostaglandin-E synthase 2
VNGPSPRIWSLATPRIGSANRLRRLFSSAQDSTATQINLYQYKICPFSNIAKVVLTYQHVSYQSIEVNPLTKAELKFSKSYRKVPIVQQGHRQWNGTEEILDHFAAVSTSDGSDDDDNEGNNNINDNNDFATSSSSRYWQDFARNKLAPLLYPNLCDNLAHSVRAFDYVHQEPRFSTVQRYSIQYLGGLAMYMAAWKIKKKYQLTDVRAALQDALVELEMGLMENNKLVAVTTDNTATNNSNMLPPTDPNIFLNPNSNTAPHLGDLAVFGVLNGLEGLAILNDDILQQKQFPKIQQWYQSMKAQVESRKKMQVQEVA